MWEKYYKEFGCDSIAFNIGNGNVLKYSIAINFEDFIDSVVNNFGLNLNMIDPSDGRTLLDFTRDEMIRYKGDLDTPERSAELEKIYLHLKNDLKAKHASEL